jgi:Protein of unknown function (DUF2924)
LRYPKIHDRSARAEIASATHRVMSLGEHSGDAEESLSRQRSPSRSESLDTTIACFSDLHTAQLCLQWRNHLGGTAPAHLPRWLLLRVLAYRLQATTLGDLDKATARIIRASQGDAIDFSGNPFNTRGPMTRNGTILNPGAMLVREWKGKLERVMVLDNGFAWNGRTFGSLSQAAKAITRTSWNGHRFFGLRSAKDQGLARRENHPKADENNGHGAARSEELGRAKSNDDKRKETKGIGCDETEQAAVTANRSGVHLAPRRGRNPKAKTHVPVENEPGRDRVDARR